MGDPSGYRLVHALVPKASILLRFLSVKLRQLIDLFLTPRLNLLQQFFGLRQPIHRYLHIHPIPSVHYKTVSHTAVRITLRVSYLTISTSYTEQHPGVHPPVKKQRRQFLQAFGITASIGLAGCSQQLEPTNGNSENGGTGEPQPGQDSGTGNDSDPEETTNDSYPETGTLQVNVDGEPLGPDGIFEGDVELKIPHTERELVEKYHHNRLQTITELDGEINDRQTLRNFPENLQDDEWVIENISAEMPDVWFEGEPKNPFKHKEYTSEEPFINRFKDSNYAQLWNLIAHTTLGGPDSRNDYIKAAGIAATEYHAADKTDNMTTSTKTNDGIHGTVWFLENTSWNPRSDQSVYIVETAPTREQQIIDFDKTGSYPHNQVFTDAKNERDTTKMAWKGFARWDPRKSYDKLSNVKLNGRDEFREAVKNPGEYGFKQFTMPSIVMEYINSQAKPEGNHPELEDATFTVNLGEGTNIEYELA